MHNNLFSLQVVFTILIIKNKKRTININPASAKTISMNGNRIKNTRKLKIIANMIRPTYSIMESVVFNEIP